MICISVVGNVLKGVVEELDKFELIELRLDQIDLVTYKEEVYKIIQNKKVILSCGFFDRKNKDIVDKLENLLEIASELILDLDINIPADLITFFKDKCAKKGFQLLLSYHDYLKTPHDTEINIVLSRILQYRPDYIKIACSCHTQRDVLRLLSYYDKFENLIVLGMGKEGRITRILANYMGAKISYCSYDGVHKTAVGQLAFQDLEQICELLDK